MHGTLAFPASKPTMGKLRLTAFAALFCLFTYALLSARAGMILGESFALLSEKRVVATLLGAGIFLAVLHVFAMSERLSLAKLAAVVATIVPASLAVLAARLLVDSFYFDRPLDFGDNLRWVILWAGYFGLWVSGALALKLHSLNEGNAAFSKVLASDPTSPPLVRVPRSQTVLPAEVDAWAWLVDTIGQEMSVLPPRGRLAILESLIVRAGYECADTLSGEGNVQAARAALVRRLAERWPE
ncbi:MAG: hypothetical protein B7Y45_01155 [Sphingomonas sp. 28-66-16]|nr:MAG: hypothetical protein B7Y45_01155 [Sphingomonas sp. 28-66-16]